MVFASFAVVLGPMPDSPMRIGCDEEALRRVVREIGIHRPDVRVDREEMERAGALDEPDRAFLVSESESGLFQMLVELHPPTLMAPSDHITVTMRFAQCNPITVFEPFCDTAAWLMERYRLSCWVYADLGPALQKQGAPPRFEKPEQVRPVLLPAMEHNRRAFAERLRAEYGVDIDDTVAPIRPGDLMDRLQGRSAGSLTDGSDDDRT